MKDHEKRELVSRITAIALEYRAAEQLRERIGDAVLPVIDAAVTAERERLLARAKNRADYEAKAAAHHAGRWHAAHEHHLTRHAAMRDLIAALEGPWSTDEQIGERDGQTDGGGRSDGAHGL